jgi:hypothetical protein
MKPQTAPDRMPTFVLLWMAIAAVYVIYAGSTYSGLYRALAELELRVFGSYDPTGTFLALLFTLCLPTRFIASRVWKKPLVKPLATPANPEKAQRQTRNTMLAIGAVALVVGVVAAGMALSQSASSQHVGELDLKRASASPPSSSGRLMVSGRLQPHYAVTIDETINGSVNRTRYTPVTAAGWHPGDPVQYVLRESLGSIEPGEEVGEPNLDLVRVGPVATFRHALPGIARTGFEQRGIKLGSSLTLLDQNLSSASEMLWIVSTFGFLFALSFLIVWAMMVRTQRLDAVAARAEAAALPVSAHVPASAGPPRHWELRLGGELMAELFFQSFEMPWIHVAIKARPGMQPFRRKFQEHTTWPDDDATIDAMLREIKRRGGFTLIPDGGAPTQSFSLIEFNEYEGSLRA